MKRTDLTKGNIEVSEETIKMLNVIRHLNDVRDEVGELATTIWGDDDLVADGEVGVCFSNLSNELYNLLSMCIHEQQSKLNSIRI